MSDARIWIYTHVQRHQGADGIKLKAIWSAAHCPVGYEELRKIVRDLHNEGFLLSIGWGRYKTNPDKKGTPPIKRDPRYRKSSAVADAKIREPRYKEQDHQFAQSILARPVIQPKIDERDDDEDA